MQSLSQESFTMKIKQFIFAASFITLITPHYVFAAPSCISKEEVAKRYLLDLAKADYKDIVRLFDKNGFVISTSRGKVNAKEFFYAFLPNVESAKTELHQIFTSQSDANRITARFHLTYQLKDGEKGNGEYVDEFIFDANSHKLSAVYMFENLKFG